MIDFLKGLRGLLCVGATIAASFFNPVLAQAAVDSPLHVPTEDVFLLPASGELEVLERIALVNQSQDVEAAKFQMPAGAQGVQVSNVAKDAVHVSGTTVTVSAKPGTTSLVVSFHYPFSDQTAVQLDLPTLYAVDLAHIYVPVGNAALSAPNLMPDSQLMSIGGTDYRVFTHGAMQAGGDLVMSLSLLPSVTPTSAIAGLHVIGTDSQSGANTLQAVGNLALAVLILAVALAGIRSTMVRNNGRHGSTMSSEDALYRSWEQLEELHECGQVDEAVYVSRRAALKNRIVELQLSSQKVGR